MIARIWHGATPTGRADAYLELMRTVALPDYKAVPGNRGAWRRARCGRSWGPPGSGWGWTSD